MKVSLRSSWFTTVFLVFLLLGFGACSSSDDDNTEWVRNGLSVVHFSLLDSETTLYEHHAFNYQIGIVAGDEIAPGSTVTANIFLVDADAQENEESEDGEPSCFVGSTQIELGPTGDDVLVTDEGMPSTGCFDPAAASAAMSFAVSLEPSDRLIRDETMEDDNVILLTQPMSGSDINQACIGADGSQGCVIEVTVEPSPGIDVELTGIELESNVVLNYSRILNPLVHPESCDPDSLAVDTCHDEMHTPSLEVTTEWWLEGVSPEQDDALQGSDHVLITYAIKPANLAQGWLPLTVLERGNLTPVGHDEEETIHDLQAGSEAHFTDSLFIEGETYEAVGPGGAWEGDFHFEIRACASPSFLEVDLPGEDEAANNCVIAPFFLTERLSYNPDILVDEDDINLTASPNSNDSTFDEYHGLYKKLEASAGDADSLRIGISLLNQARFGVSGVHDGANIAVTGSGVPYATLGSTLTGYLEGFIDAELLLVDFTHSVTHKDPANGPNWTFDRSYKPSVRLHMFGIHFIEVVGSMALPDGTTTITNNDLETMSQMFATDEDEAPANDESISFAQRLCEKTGIDALVMELSIDICATGNSGVNYGLTFDSIDVGSRSRIGATAWIDPYAELDLQGDLTVDLGLLKGQLRTTAALMKLHLTHESLTEPGEYEDGGAFFIASLADGEFSNEGQIGTEGYLAEEILNGSISFEGERVNGIQIKCCFHPKAKWKAVSKELYSWDGITIGQQKLWDESFADIVSVPGR